MHEKNHPTNKSALLETIDKERKTLVSLINELSDLQKLEPGVEGNWSIKDIMAHIAAWERLAMDRLLAATTDQPLKFPVMEGDDFIDRFNADVYQTNKDLDLTEIETEFESSHQNFFDLLEDLDEGFLSQKLPFDWAGNLTAQVLISANTHWHYIDHSETIEKWLQKQLPK